MPYCPKAFRSTPQNWPFVVKLEVATVVAGGII